MPHVYSAPKRLAGKAWLVILTAILVFTMESANAQPSIEKVVVLTFDDSVKSHRTYVAPLLKELGFGATFFITHRWMNDTENFMTWEEIAEIHQMGFEIGNHTWTHPQLAAPKAAGRLHAELALIDYELHRVKVPKPISFAYTGNGFGPEAVKGLQELGYRFARRGMQPEIPYGKMQIGPGFDPQKHHPLLIPTTADAYPDWTMEHFQKAISSVAPGEIIVLQFHGVPDIAHPWVHTPPEKFKEYMLYLKENGYRAIAMRDLEAYIDFDNLPDDPMLKVRYPEPKEKPFAIPVEMEATRANPKFWLYNMLLDHHYTWQEASLVTGWDEETTKAKAKELGIDVQSENKRDSSKIYVQPFPGGRHPRIGNLDAAIDPMRGTKASIFLPWSPGEYVVLDVPEAIWVNTAEEDRLLYLAHTHIPTLWDDQHIWLDNVDWTVNPDGSLKNQWELPNKVKFGAVIQPQADSLDLSMWLTNGSEETLTGLRTQVCIMPNGVKAMTAHTNENKVYDIPVSACYIEGTNRWVLTAWDRCWNTWGNKYCPCYHSDPAFPDCEPGQTVEVKGRIWFYEGGDIQGEIDKNKDKFLKPIKP